VRSLLSSLVKAVKKSLLFNALKALFWTAPKEVGRTFASHTTSKERTSMVALLVLALVAYVFVTEDCSF